MAKKYQWLLVIFFLPQYLFADEPIQTLINGKIADIKDYPASVWVRRCSATVVGQRTVFIAAHCVTSNNRVSFSVGANQYNASCTYSSDYAKNKTADYALCVTDKVVSGIPYEKINTDPERFKVGDSLLLTGYGCTNLKTETGGNDGTYRVGTSTVRRLPVEPNNDIYTSSGAALCPGDSGGPAFYIDESTGERYVTSANSRVDSTLRSYLPATYTTQGLAFFKSWTEKNNEKICGFNEDATGCRGTNINPTPNSFKIFHRLVNIEGIVTPGNEHRVEELKNLVTESLIWAQ